MSEKPVSVEDKIILATIDCIEKFGISGSTNRQIAKMAGVNLAAINYYFRNKDTLIERVMEMTLANAFDLSDLDIKLGATPQESLSAVLLHLIQGGLRYPNLTRAHFYSMLAEGQENPILVRHMNRFTDTLVTNSKALGCTMDENDLRIAVVQAVAAVFMVILAPTLFQPQPGFELRDEATAQSYATRLAVNLLHC